MGLKSELIFVFPIDTGPTFYTSMAPGSPLSTIQLHLLDSIQSLFTLCILNLLILSSAHNFDGEGQHGAIELPEHTASPMRSPSLGPISSTGLINTAQKPHILLLSHKPDLNSGQRAASPAKKSNCSLNNFCKCFLCQGESAGFA